MSDGLVIGRTGPVTTLTLDRPKRINALDAGLVEALLAALDAARRDGTRLVVFRGAGKGFSAGFDFSALETQSDGDLVLRFIRLEQLLQAVWNAPFVTLALAHGPCFGAAADLVAACGMRVAASDATFRMPGLRFGIALGTRRLAALVGTDAARSLLTATPTFDAAEAQRIGFLMSIAGPEAWDDIVAETAEAACVLPESSLARMHALTRQDAGLRDTGPQDSGSRDMAALVASLAEPGLKARIQGYLASLKQQR